MIKKVIVFILAFIICASCVSCMTREEELTVEVIELETKVSNLAAEVANLEAQKAQLLQDITNIKVENDMAKYIITIEIRQQFHFNSNTMKTKISVDKEFYDSVSVGDVIERKRIRLTTNSESPHVWMEIVVQGKEIR